MSQICCTPYVVQRKDVFHGFWKLCRRTQQFTACKVLDREIDEVNTETGKKTEKRDRNDDNNNRYVYSAFFEITQNAVDRELYSCDIEWTFKGKK